MALIDLFDIKKQYDVKLLLNDVNFHLNTGERIAVVGQNGCGKSTLMKIALGIEEPTEGKRVVNSSLQVEMLAQQPHFEADLTVRDAILGELTELKTAQEEHAKLSLEVANDFENKELLAKLEEITAFLGYAFLWHAQCMEPR